MNWEGNELNGLTKDFDQESNIEVKKHLQSQWERPMPYRVWSGLTDTMFSDLKWSMLYSGAELSFKSFGS